MSRSLGLIYGFQRCADISVICETDLDDLGVVVLMGFLPRIPIVRKRGTFRPLWFCAGRKR